MNLAIAKSAVEGKLDSNPFVQGLLVNLMQKVDKESRHIYHWRGRRAAQTETQERLVEDAALTLAIVSGNRGLAEELGQRKTMKKLHLEDLALWSLPNPCLSLMFSDQLLENLRIVEQQCVRVPGQSCRRMIASLDHTYILKFLVQMKVQGKAGLIGGAWTPENEESAFMPFDALPPHALSVDKAGLMLEILLWNPDALIKEAFSVSAMPMTLRRSKKKDLTLTKQGNMDS